MNTAAKGRRNEHKSMKLLELAGYTVIRSAASKGLWDLVGISPVDIICLQVKSNRPPSSVELEGLKLAKVPSNAKKLLHIWLDGQRQPIVKEI